MTPAESAATEVWTADLVTSFLARQGGNAEIGCARRARTQDWSVFISVDNRTWTISPAAARELADNLREMSLVLGGDQHSEALFEELMIRAATILVEAADECEQRNAGSAPRRITFPAGHA